MGKDRQEKKMRARNRSGPDRDQALHYPGSTKLSSPEEARKLNDSKYSLENE
ncbi:YpzI family protein [Bacillus marasmi]|uniref:YpzI family protein n=1 Tax=Bacillus marasmi TaxID=1926279 RepID=UPI0011C71AAA|nr:YpzI family protein [Bacillus marasmi]